MKDTFTLLLLLLLLLLLFSVFTQAQTIETDTLHFTGTQKYLGKPNKAILEFRFATDNPSLQIKKPLIVVEGFDSGLLGIENEFGENDLSHFITEIMFDTGSLGNEINTYDIIYINFKEGRDYMQRNAYLVEDIIKWVNTVKEGTAPNVVLGQSMGGLIARYALADMEKKKINTGLSTWDHQTSLYISHDAPHLGANIPIAIQYLARHLADQFISTPIGDMNINVTGNGGAVSIEDMEDVLNSPGTKQLLANYIDSGFALTNTVGDAWRTELHGLGYPLLCRNIALSNGNHCALPQNFNPSDNLFKFSGGGQTSTLTDLLIYLLPSGNIISGVSLAVLFNEPALLIGILPGNSKFNLDFNGKALPTPGANEEIYKGRVSFTKTLFRLFGWAPKITVNLTNRSIPNPVNLSYDTYPGGRFESFLQNGNTSLNNVFLNFGITMEARENFNFIPTPSALDVGSGNAILNNADYSFKYNTVNPPVNSKSIPFDNYATSFNTNGINENHISFSSRNGNWLAQELQANSNTPVYPSYNCSFICENVEILGNKTICTSETFTVPAGAPSYTWTISGSGASITSSSSN